MSGAAYLVKGEAVTVPTGIIVGMPSAASMTGWLLCDGSSYDTTSYSALYSILGTSNVPNLVDRFPRYLSTTTSGTSGNVTSLGGGTNLSIDHANEIPEHDHGSSNLTHDHFLGQWGALNYNTGNSPGNGNDIYMLYLEPTKFWDNNAGPPGRACGYYNEDETANESFTAGTGKTFLTEEPDITISSYTGSANTEDFSIMPAYMDIAYFIKAD